MELKDDEKKLCSWCRSVIKIHYIVSDSKYFCDVICAKIFNDNVAKIDITENTFINGYINNSLREKDKKLYEKTAELCFGTLPLMKFDGGSKKEFKSNCYRLVLSYC